MEFNTQGINSNLSGDIQEENDISTDNPEQLCLGLESPEVLETIHHISSVSGALAGNIIGDICPSCQGEFGVTGFCGLCGYSMNDDHNNKMEGTLSKQELFNHLNTLEGLFEDVDIEDVKFDLQEIDGRARDRTTFSSKGFKFVIISLGKSASYSVEGYQFHLSDIPQKSASFGFLRAKLNISNKGKFKQRNILEETGEDGSYMKDLSFSSFRDLPEYKGNQYKGKFIHIEGKIQESQAELHFMFGGKKYRVTVKYNIGPNSNHDPDSGLVASGLSILKYQVLNGNKWLDEGRLKKRPKRNI